jgi:hypothetical protein
MSQQLQCVGCAGQNYWPFSGTLVALCGPVWSLLGGVGIWLVALARRITFVTNAKAPVAIGGHEPGLAGGRWNTPVTGDNVPYRGGS